jgi:hypothetical protein
MIKMKNNGYDFDLKLQQTFNDNFSEIGSADWRSWLKISSRDEYEALVFKLSGLPMGVLEEVKNTVTDPESVSIDPKLALGATLPDSWIDDECRRLACFLCHTSGTSGGNISQLKWFHFSEKVIRSVWAPGMRAIFESSGLDKDSAAIIFVPSRIRYDGLEESEDSKIVRLYTSEFSQRLILSLINPKSYLIDFYRNSRSVSTLSRMLSMDNISVVSAPYKTILGWVDAQRMRRSLKISLSSKDSDKSPLDPEEISLIEMTKKKGLEKAVALIQERLKKKLSKATLIFSSTGLSEQEWVKIRRFFNWKKGEERFTNLYVGSETGPFAGGIEKEEKKNMVVFPLTLPAILRRGKIELLHRSKFDFGRLLISKMDDKPMVNLDTGDIITVVKKDGIPRIEGEVLRSGFEINRNVRAIGYPRAKKVFAGDYFDFNDFEIVNPRKIMACISEKINRRLDPDNPVFLVSGETSKIILPLEEGDSDLLERKQREIVSCPGGLNLERALTRKKLQLEVGKTGINNSINDQQLLSGVHNGDLPKGVLKKWPFYHIVT